jgi:hypothetical protein
MLPSTGTLSELAIANEVGAPTSAIKFAGSATPSTDSLVYYYRSGNVNTAGVNQTADFKFSEFWGQEAKYKCTSYTAGGSTGTATIVLYPGISTNISVPAGNTYYYCTRINYNDVAAITSVSGLTVVTGSICNGSSSVGNSVAATNTAYGIYGVKLFSTVNSSGGGTNISWLCDDIGGTYSSTFWANPSNNTSDGRLNQTGLWTGSVGGYAGTGSLTINVVAPSTKTYYIGTGFDNYGTLTVNGTRIFSQSPQNSVDNFRYWNIYPISLTAGSNLIFVQDVNLSTGAAALGAEIYDNTSTEISASVAASPNGSSIPSGLNVLYSSANNKGAGVIGISYYNTSVQCPVTTTSTTTTTTTTATATVTFYGVMGDLSNSQAVLYYSTDNSTWNPIAASFSYTCGFIDIITVNIGDTVYVSIGDPSLQAYYYNAQVGTSCPFNSATYCGNGSKFSTVVSTNTDIAITQYVTGGDILSC